MKLHIALKFNTGRQMILHIFLKFNNSTNNLEKSIVQQS